jgi:hypothetical protein
LFYSIFSKSYHPSHFKNYGAIEIALSSEKEYFLPLAKNYYDQWKSLIEKSGLYVTTEQEDKIKATLDKIAMIGAKVCTAKILSAPISPVVKGTIKEDQEPNLDEQVENQVENHKETDNELQLQQELLTEKNIVEKNHEVLPFLLSRYFQAESGFRNEQALDVNDSYIAGKNGFFDKNIFISVMQAKTTLVQNTYYSRHVKPIHSIMMVMDKTNPELLDSFILAKKESDYYANMTPAELQALHPDKHVWLVAPSDKLLAGNRPNTLPSHYLRTLEQIRFINGDVKKIGQQEKLTWLSENTEQKMKFLRDTILPRFRYKAKSYNLLNKRVKALSKDKEQQADNEYNREFETKVASETKIAGETSHIKLSAKRKNPIVMFTRSIEILKRQKDLCLGNSRKARKNVCSSVSEFFKGNSDAKKRKEFIPQQQTSKQKTKRQKV